MKRLFIYLFTPLFVWTCSDDHNKEKKSLPEAKPIELRSTLVPRISQDNSFAFNLFKQVYQSEPSNNQFISPLSVSMVLSMILNGAKGDTHKGIEKTLQIKGFSTDEINEYCKTLREALLNVDPTTEFSIANSIWYRSGFQVEKEFLHVNRASFYAETNEADFSNPTTLNRINQWCADNTRNRIPKILNQIPDAAVMYLINATYFKGIWQSKFNKNQTFDGSFYNSDGTKRIIKMMKQTEKFRYYADETASYLTLPYGNGAFSMRLILPNNGKTVDDVIDQLDSETWHASLDENVVKVNLQVPRFKIECKYELGNSILPAMGMSFAFTPFADFTSISKDGGICISEVIHKTYIAVDEEGTEAAGVTRIGVITTSLPQAEEAIDFFVNKPFVFVIRENSTGVILFSGSIKTL